jgi:hypothetical protein
MDQDFQTSFIPKKPAAAAPVASQGAPARRKKSSGIFMLVAIIVFVAAILSAGGVFAYKSYLVSSVEAMKVSLERERDVFEPETISAMQELSKRIEASEQILSKHVAVSPIFNELSEITYPDIQYTSFTYSLDGTGNIFVEMAGRSSDFATVGLQSNKFSQNKHFKNPIFSNLVRDQVGRVTFDLTFSVDRAFATYGSPLNDTLPVQGLPQ